MGTHHPIRKTVAPEIPDKLYFRIGDVARLCEVPAYVLRFWETEFPQLKPNKGGTGQRLYRKRDVEMALRIKSLLYDQGYTIPGARQVFKAELKPAELKPVELKPEPKPRDTPFTLATMPSENAIAPAAREEKLRALHADLRSLATLLGKPAGELSMKSGKVQTMRPRLEPIKSKQLSLEGELF